LVRGRPRKRRGSLVDVDLGRLRTFAETSRDHVLRSTGLTSQPSTAA